MRERREASRALAPQRSDRCIHALVHALLLAPPIKGRGSSRQMPRAERLRQKVGQLEGPAHALGTGDMDQGRRVGEFANALAAAAAGRAEGLAVADDADLGDPPLARVRSWRRWRSSRRTAFGIGGVLDVAAGDRSRPAAVTSAAPTLKRE